MKHLDLFSGIGGFALAARWAGIETVQFVEIDPFCQKVLAKNFPGVPIHDDIKTFRGERFRGIDLLTGGSPCQPYSVAGKQLGEADDRALWREMFRVIDEARPRFVVGENVAGFVRMALDNVLSDLEGIGYTCQAVVIPACAVNAPHKRERVWILAHTSSVRWGERGVQGDGDCERLVPKGIPNNRDKMGRESSEYGEATTNPDCTGFCKSGQNGNSFNYEANGVREADTSINIVGRYWQDIEPCVRRGDNGLPKKLDSARRVKALGNAIVPQVAYHILKALQEVDKCKAH